jgi:hypothetical protein
MKMMVLSQDGSQTSIAPNTDDPARHFALLRMTVANDAEGSTPSLPAIETPEGLK